LRNSKNLLKTILSILILIFELDFYREKRHKYLDKTSLIYYKLFL